MLEDPDRWRSARRRVPAGARFSASWRARRASGGSCRWLRARRRRGGTCPRWWRDVTCCSSTIDAIDRRAPSVTTWIGSPTFCCGAARGSCAVASSSPWWTRPTRMRWISTHCRQRCWRGWSWAPARRARRSVSWLDAPAVNPVASCDWFPAGRDRSCHTGSANPDWCVRRGPHTRPPRPRRDPAPRRAPMCRASWVTRGCSRAGDARQRWRAEAVMPPRSDSCGRWSPRATGAATPGRRPRWPCRSASC